MAEPEPRTKRSTLDPETLRIIERARDGALLMMQETACGMLEGYPWSARMNAVANELIAAMEQMDAELDEPLD